LRVIFFVPSSETLFGRVCYWGKILVECEPLSVALLNSQVEFDLGKVTIRSRSTFI